jgi:hypothetical protein
MQIRKRYEDEIVSIGAVIQNASLFNTQNWLKGSSMEYQNLPNSVEKFLQIIEETETEIVLVGGIALLAYIKDRNTQDLDLIISRQDYGRLAWFLDVLYLDEDFANCETQDGLRVDFLFTDNIIYDYVRKAFCKKIKFSENEILVATPEGLILMKLYAWTRLRNDGYLFGDKDKLTKAIRYKTDIEVLSVNYEIEFAGIFRVLGKCLGTADLETCRNLIENIKREHGLS